MLARRARFRLSTAPVKFNTHTLQRDFIANCQEENWNSLKMKR